MSAHLRSWRELLRIVAITMRVDRRRALVTLLPLVPLCAGVMAVASRALIDAAGRDDHAALLVATIVAAGANAAFFVVIYWQVATGSLRLAQITGVELDRILLRRATASPSIALFDDPDVLDRIELLRVNKGALTMSVALIRDLLWVVGNIAFSALLLAVVDPRLAVLAVLIVPTGWVYFRAEDITENAERAMAEHRREALHLYDVGTSPAHGKELRTFGQAATVRARRRRTWTELDGALTRAHLRAAAARVATFTVVATITAVVVLAVVHDIAAESIQPYEVFLLVLGVVGIADTAGYSGVAASSARRALRMVENLTTVMDRAPLPQGTLSPPARLASGIGLHGVGFHYPGDETAVLSEIDLHLDAGTTVAVVGENGAGKSTLVKLLCGLYEPSAGRMTIDGVDRDEIDANGWSTCVALVAQDFARFELVARESVGVGDLSAIDDGEAVGAAVERAGASPVIDRLPDGLATQLGSSFGGRDLSGGQWQRLAVARGMMRRTPLLLAMDEPTGALDAQAEHELLSRCLEDSRRLAEVAGSVVVYVSHRYSTVRLADRIIVLDGGRVVEDGNHAELMALGGRYASLYQRQASAYA